MDQESNYSHDNVLDELNVESCLDAAERHRPFFIGLLGEATGWVPDDDDVPRIKKFDWIFNYKRLLGQPPLQELQVHTYKFLLNVRYGNNSIDICILF